MASELRRIAITFGLTLLACGGPSTAPQAPGANSSAPATASAAPTTPPQNPHRAFGKLEAFRPGDDFASPCFAHDGSLYRYAATGDREAAWKILRIDLTSRKESDLWRGDSMGTISFNRDAAFKPTERGVVRIPLSGGQPRLYEIEGVEDVVAEDGRVWIRREREIGDGGPVTEILSLIVDTGAVTRVATLGSVMRSTNGLFLSPTKMAAFVLPRRHLRVFDRTKAKLEEELVLDSYFEEVMPDGLQSEDTAVQAGVSVVFDGPVMYFLYNDAEGHELVSASPAKMFPDRLHSDARPWQGRASLQVDDAYLYYPVASPDSDLRISLLRFYKGGGEPEEIAELREVVSTAMDGDFIYLCGLWSGAIQRLRIR